MSRLNLGRGALILACTASLAGAASIAPAAASAAGAVKCGSKSVTLKLEDGETTKVPVKAITVEGGVTCTQAVKVIAGVLVGKPPSGWKSATAHYKLPKSLSEQGLLPQEAKKGSKKVRYAVHGG